MPAERPEEPPSDGQWRGTGDRIQSLLDATSAGGAAMRERAEELVGEVVDLYGAGLERILTVVADASTPDILDRLAADDLVASLLLVHGLHPHDIHRRISDALERVRPYLGSHGGDVDLLEVDGDKVRLQFLGSCSSCPSSAATLELTIEDAVRAAAPEISSIEVVAGGHGHAASASTVIPAESLLTKIRGGGGVRPVWHQVPDLAGLVPGEVGGFLVDGTTVLACRVGDALYAYRDHCPVCDGSLAGAVLHRPMTSKDPVLRCPRCRGHFDVVHAGAGVDHPDAHLDPVPLLVRDGVWSIALPAESLGVSA